MKKNHNGLLESFIETIESSKFKRELWLKRVGQFGLDQALGEYDRLMQIDSYGRSNDQQIRNQ